MLEDIRDGSQTHPNINKREARYKICERVRQKESQQRYRETLFALDEACLTTLSQRV